LDIFGIYYTQTRHAAGTAPGDPGRFAGEGDPPHGLLPGGVFPATRGD